MSKYVKNLLSDDLARRLDGVNDALLVNMIGLTANQNNELRGVLAEKGIQVLVVKNSLAQRALKDSPLDGLFDEIVGANAICWGAEDVVSLAKEVVKLHDDKDFPTFEARGGIMDGETLSSTEVISVSKWPSRDEQIAMLVGQACGMGGRISGQIKSVGGALASQIEQKAEGDSE